jgi:tetratricopeptide (TPR) repeat protein
MNETEAVALLRRGEWDAARGVFDALVRERPSAAAWEGLGEAAWWQDDADAVFESRERAYQLYREAGDDLGAARMATWLGSDYLDFRGEPAVSNGWRELARKLLADLPTSVEHAWFAFFEADTVLFEEDTEAAQRWAQEAIAISRRLKLIDVEALASAAEGLALVNEGDLAGGMSRLDRAAAMALSGELKEPFAFNTVLCHLIYACEAARDFTRAAQWCQRAREYADRIGFAFAQGVCRVHYAGVLLWRGRWRRSVSWKTPAAT